MICKNVHSKISDCSFCFLESSLAVHTILGLRLAFNFRKDLGDKVSLIAILAFPLVNLLFIIPSGAMTCKFALSNTVYTHISYYAWLHHTAA